MFDYAVYKGEEVLVVGTAQQCAEKLEVSVATIRFYATPVHRKRVKKSKNPEERMIAERVSYKESDD